MNGTSWTQVGTSWTQMMSTSWTELKFDHRSSENMRFYVSSLERS